MNTIVEYVLRGRAAEAQTGSRPFHFVVLFCGIGLLVSLCMVSLGLNISGEIL